MPQILPVYCRQILPIGVVPIGAAMRGNTSAAMRGKFVRNVGSSERLAEDLRWYGIRHRLEAPMDTVLFTDHDIVVFVIATSATALVLSVLGLATTHRIRSDIEHQFRR